MSLDLLTSTQISQYEPFLRSLALKIVGSIEDAEDIVQEVFLKFFSRNVEKIENVKAYLAKAVVNSCYTHLEALKKKKDECINKISSAELFELYKDIPKIDLEIELSEALKLLSKKLEPMEKAVFILREVFDFDYADMQDILDKKMDNCRQLLRRAKLKLNQDIPKINFNNNGDQHRTFFENFKKACHLGSASEMIADLLSDTSKK